MRQGEAAQGGNVRVREGRLDLPRQGPLVLPALRETTLGHSGGVAERSVEKDSETQITVVTKNKELRENLHKEQSRLFDQAKQVNTATFAQVEWSLMTQKELRVMNIKIESIFLFIK